jgi:hypothetical protein
MKPAAFHMFPSIQLLLGLIALSGSHLSSWVQLLWRQYARQTSQLMLSRCVVLYPQTSLPLQSLNGVMFCHRSIPVASQAIVNDVYKCFGCPIAAEVVLNVRGTAIYQLTHGRYKKFLVIPERLIQSFGSSPGVGLELVLAETFALDHATVAYNNC